MIFDKTKQNFTLESIWFRSLSDLLLISVYSACNNTDQNGSRRTKYNYLGSNYFIPYLTLSLIFFTSILWTSNRPPSNKFKLFSAVEEENFCCDS